MGGRLRLAEATAARRSRLRRSRGTKRRAERSSWGRSRAGQNRAGQSRVSRSRAGEAVGKPAGTKALPARRPRRSLREEARGRAGRRRFLLDAGGAARRPSADGPRRRRARWGSVGEPTSSRPSSSMPAARPWPSTRRSRDRAARRGRARRRASGPAGRPAALERGEQLGEQRLDLRAPAAECGRAGAQLGGQVLQPHGDVEADPEHRPALLRATLDEDARELREPRRTREYGGRCRWAT